MTALFFFTIQPAPCSEDGRSVWEDPLAGPLPGCWSAPAGRISSAAVRRDRLWVGLERLGAKVASGSGRELYSARRPDLAASRGRGLSARCALSPPRGRDGAPCSRRDCSTGADCPQCAPTASRRQGGDRLTFYGRQGSAAMSATHPTRLETRTKESNARASQRVKQTPWRNESEGRRAPAEVGSRPRGAGRTTGPSRPHRRGGGA